MESALADLSLVDERAPQPAATPAPASPSGALLDRLLRDGDGLTTELLAAADTRPYLASLAALTAGGAAVFGLALGLQGGLLQALVSAVKFPLVVLGAAAISLPLLHLAQAVFGRPLPPDKLSAVVLQALATATLTMAGLIPLAVIAWLSLSRGAGPESAVAWMAYRRLVLGAVAAGAVGGVVGARRLARAVSWPALLPWTGALGLAGLQLSWLLRPVVGMPGALVLLRPLESDGLTEVLTALAAALGLS